MKIAIISDIHGNYHALQKVIEDAKANEVDRFIFAGDYIFDLPFANEVVHTLMAMENTVVIAGNKEKYLRTDEQKLWVNIQMASASQVYSELHEDVYNYLFALKDECMITLDSGKKIYVTHYFKGMNQMSKENCSSSGFHRKMLQSPFTHEDFLEEFNALINQEQLKEIIDKIDASVIVFGHNHLQAYGYCGNKLVINPGSCGQPCDFIIDAPYTIIEETAGGFNVIERRVEYDVESVIDIAKCSKMYAKGKIWCELVSLALRTGRDYFGIMFEIARRIAADKGESGKFFSDDTWVEAYAEFIDTEKKSLKIRKYTGDDIPTVTDIWNEINDEGMSFPWDEHLDIEYVRNVFSRQTEAYCACVNEVPIGFYILHPNSVGREKHIANALYAVRKEYRGQGIGKKLILHSIEMAEKHKFIGMQYNSVVATNPAVLIYKKIGFEQIGVVRDGFKVNESIYSDILIFYMKF